MRYPRARRVRNTYYLYLASTVLKLSMQAPLVVLRDGCEADEQPEVFETTLDALKAELDTLDDHVEAIRSSLGRTW